jgi:hypothetical protein
MVQTIELHIWKLRAPIQPSGCSKPYYGNYVQLECNRPDAQTTPSEHGLVMETKELDMLIIHMGMELKLRKTLCHFLVAQLQDLEPNVSRKH